MTYPNLFRSRYPKLSGRDWLTRVYPEDIKAFQYIGLRESDFGRKGGLALVEKRGVDYMREIGRRGALVTNVRKMIEKGIENESSN